MRIPEEALGLRELYSPVAPEHQSADAATIDIVAIHGKGAHPVETWSTLRGPGLNRGDPSSWINWLDDGEMLPAVFPTARILSYGYRSDWLGEDALSTRAAAIAEGLLDELQRARKDALLRPLIFVAHSFGGLVLLKTLLLAQPERCRWPGLFDSTIGLVLLGVPLRGTDSKLHMEFLHEAEEAVGLVMHENHRASNAENDWLRDLFDDFVDTVRRGARFHIACFYEQQLTDLGLLLKGRGNFTYEPGKHLVLLVDERSACFDRATNMIGKYPRACNHFALNKFSSMKLREWESLVQVIRDMQQDFCAPAANRNNTTSMQNVHGDNFTGDKTQYNNTGSGPMINGASGTISFGVNLPRDDLSFQKTVGICLGRAPYIDPKFFFGRESELIEMRAILKPGDPSAEQRRLVLGGPGGMGKTQLAIAFAKKHYRKCCRFDNEHSELVGHHLLNLFYLRAT